MVSLEFFIDKILPVALSQEYSLLRADKLTTDCHELWETQPPGTLRTCPDLYKDYFTFTFNYSLIIDLKYTQRW
jgi:hypothetical protein